MKYDFETVVDRQDAPYSYSVKWANKGPGARMMKDFIGVTDFPEDRLCFFTADMDLKCPPELTAALVKTAEHGIFGYSMAPDEFYDAIRGWFHNRFDWDFEQDDIFVGTTGTHDLVAECVRTYTQPGDGVVVMLPCYGFRGDVEPYGRNYVGVPMNNDNGYYTIDFEAFEKACADEKNTMFVMVHPHNPTGRVFTEEELLKIAEICRKHNVLIVADQVHIDIARKGQKVLPVIKAVGPKGVINAVAINKTFNVAGLALSCLIIQDPELKEKFKGGAMMVSPFAISAVISAFTECADWVDQLNEYLDGAIDYTVEHLKASLPKAVIAKPEGTYVIWIDLSGYGLTDEELEEKLKPTHVILGDGRMFDAENPKQYRRICLTAPMVQVKDMCERLANAFKDC